MKRISTVIVDDDAYARDLLGSILRGLECNVDHSVSSGEEAISKCCRTRVDILFLDIEMPGLNGFETLEEILQGNPDQYVVMISAHSTLDNVKKAIGLGAKGFIVKPYTGAKVRDVLDKYTRDHAPPRARQAVTTEGTPEKEAALPEDAENSDA
jgi:two-component system chemotaxis response regulator CheY